MIVAVKRMCGGIIVLRFLPPVAKYEKEGMWKGMCLITKGLRQGEKEGKIAQTTRRQAKTNRTNGRPAPWEQQCKRFESNEVKTEFEETKRKKGAETLVTTRKTSRNSAETLPGQGTLYAAGRYARYHSIRAPRMGLQPAHSLETGAAAACSRFVLRSAAHETRHGGDPRREAVEVSGLP